MSVGQFFANAVLAVTALIVACMVDDFTSTHRGERIGYAIAAALAAIPLFHVIVFAVAG
jgi:hypothetical protein